MSLTAMAIYSHMSFISLIIRSSPFAMASFTPASDAHAGFIDRACSITADSLIGAALFIVFIVVLQQLEGNLIYPRVVGASIGLPGIWVLTAVTIGGAVGGIAGMLIGVPLCAAVYKLLKSDVKSREEKVASETLAQTPTEPLSETAESSGGAEETIV